MQACKEKRGSHRFLSDKYHNLSVNVMHCAPSSTAYKPFLFSVHPAPPSLPSLPESAPGPTKPSLILVCKAILYPRPPYSQCKSMQSSIHIYLFRAHKIFNIIGFYISISIGFYMPFYIVMLYIMLYIYHMYTSTFIYLRRYHFS